MTTQGILNDVEFDIVLLHPDYFTAPNEHISYYNRPCISPSDGQASRLPLDTDPLQRLLSNKYSIMIPKSLYAYQRFRLRFFFTACPRYSNSLPLSVLRNHA